MKTIKLRGKWAKYSRMDQVKFMEDNFLKVWSDIVCLSRPYQFKFFQGCLPQILLGPFLNTLPRTLLIEEQPYRKIFKIILENLISVFSKTESQFFTELNKPNIEIFYLNVTLKLFSRNYIIFLEWVVKRKVIKPSFCQSFL